MKHELGTEPKSKPLSPEQALAHAVILRGLMDVRAKGEAMRNEARAWMESDALDTWCSILGVDVSKMRRGISCDINVNGWGGGGNR